MTFADLVNNVIGFINSIVIPLIFALGLLVFLWGVAKYFIFPGGDAEKEKGRQIIIWGIVAFVVMVIVWGLVNAIAYFLFPELTCTTNPALCHTPF